MNSAAIRQMVVTALTGTTSAGDRVFSPRDWSTSPDMYPVLLVQTPFEQKKSQGRNTPAFTTLTTVRITGRVQEYDGDTVDDGAMRAELALESLREQVERAVINSYELTRNIQKYAEVRSTINVDSEGEAHTVAGATVKTNYLKLVSTAVLSTIARVKSEIRGVTQAINTIRGTVTFWTNMVDSTISQVTNLSNVLNSTFGNTRYGRYSKGSVGGSSSAVAGKSSVADVDDERALADKVTAQSVMDRKNVTDRSSQLSSSNTPDEFVQGVADVVNAILNSAGSVNDRITALEKLANSISTEYQQSDSSKAISATMNTLIVVLCTGAMTSAAADSRPASTDEAEELTQRVSVQLDTALVLAGDRADDDMYNALLAVRSAFLSTMSERASGLSELLQVTTAQPLPALTLANRLYQDATRADELVQEARVPHPAFMPTTMKVLRQ